MRVFVTGASGWIGTHVVRELLANGHQVVGLARSDESAVRVHELGAEVSRGDLDDLDSLRRGASSADAVVHLANKHDFARPSVSNAAERAATHTLGEVLAGTGKPLVLASGLALPRGGSPATEADASPAHGPDSLRGGSENLALDFVRQGVGTVITRFAPTVHGTGDHGFIAFLVASARRDGEALVADDGNGRWPAVHVQDAAVVVRLGLEKAEPGTILHAAAEEGVRTGDIAAAIGAGVGVPVRSVPAAELAERYGFIGGVFGLDIPASSVRTRELLGWSPAHRGLIADIEGGAYFSV